MRRGSRRGEEEQGGRDSANYERRKRARDARHARQEVEDTRRGCRREEEDHVRSRRYEGGAYRSMNEFPPIPRPGNGRRGAGPAPRARA